MPEAKSYMIPKQLVWDACNGSTNGFVTERARRCTGWGASRNGTRVCLSCGNSGRNPRRERRSRMKRELHVRFCEGGGVQLPSATRPNLYRNWNE